MNRSKTQSIIKSEARTAAWRLLSLLFVGILLAPSAGWAADARIGFINIKKAVAFTKEFKRSKKGFESNFKKEQKVISEREAKLKDMLKDLNKTAFTLKPEAKKQKEENFLRQKKQLERYVQDKNETFKKQEQEITLQVTQRMLTVIKTIGKQKKFTLIIEKNATFYFDNAMDITDLAIKNYNKIHK